MRSGSLPRRRNLAALIVTLLVGWIACADAQSPPMAKAEPVDKAALLAELMKLEVASWQYLKDANISAMKQYLGDDAIMIFSNGKRFTKAQLIDAMPYIQLDSVTIGPDADIKVWTPEVATLVYRVTYTTGPRNTHASTTKVLSSSTYARRDGRWVSELYQETPAP
jgi:Domain of unknown function (DUF4440)